MPTIRVLPEARILEVPAGSNLLKELRAAGFFLDAPCGGAGKCGKCVVAVNGAERLSCQITVTEDMTVSMPVGSELRVLDTGVFAATKMDPQQPGHLLAVDIGTTSVVCFLLSGEDGRELAAASALNAQTAFGADVISRIRAALDGELETLQTVIREELCSLISEVCTKAGIEAAEIGTAAVVGNPAMQQLFMGISPGNLVEIPFAPRLTAAKVVPCRDWLPPCENAALLVVPDISGYIGADTMGCVLSTKMYEADELTLLVDIGTNGEMVLGNKERMIACSTAAGPALEGANIRFGMRGMEGAIDHVSLENDTFSCSVIGEGEARGICGSGLIDAVAAALEAGLINKRGRILGGGELDGQRVIMLRDGVYLTQDDIRQVQMAKGAICAGVQLMAKQLGCGAADIKHVLLAGAFGSFMDPASACRIGLLPEELQGRITAVGNAAGSGAKMLACDKEQLTLSQRLVEKIEFLELASLPEFSGTFARAMGFRERKC